jgi:hypothetical protein
MTKWRVKRKGFGGVVDEKVTPTFVCHQCRCHPVQGHGYIQGFITSQTTIPLPPKNYELQPTSVMAIGVAIIGSGTVYDTRSSIDASKLTH